MSLKIRSPHSRTPLSISPAGGGIASPATEVGAIAVTPQSHIPFCFLQAPQLKPADPLPPPAFGHGACDIPILYRDWLSDRRAQSTPPILPIPPITLSLTHPDIFPSLPVLSRRNRMEMDQSSRLEVQDWPFSAPCSQDFFI